MWLHAVVQQVPLAPFVSPEEKNSAWERTHHGREPTAVEAASDAFLPPYRVVGGAQGRILRREVGITLLSRLDGIERMHEHVASCTS